MRIGNCDIQSFPLRLQKGGRGLPKGRAHLYFLTNNYRILSYSSTIIPFHLILLFIILIDTLPFLKTSHRSCFLIVFMLILYPQRKILCFSDGTDIILLLYLFVSVTMFGQQKKEITFLFIFIFLIPSFSLPSPNPGA